VALRGEGKKGGGANKTLGGKWKKELLQPLREQVKGGAKRADPGRDVFARAIRARR